MKKLNKLIITKWEDTILTTLVSGNEILRFQAEDGSERSLLNHIYIGKVKHVVGNINSAFVEIGNGQMAYYSLTENTSHHYAKPHSGTKLRAGDEIMVQVAKDAIKTKDPVLTSCFNFPGKYCVLTVGKNTIGFSNKIADESWKQEMKVRLEAEKDADFGIIIRTNAKEAQPERILEEVRRLKERYRQVMTEGMYRTCFSLLYEAEASYIESVRDAYSAETEAIITDDTEIFATLKAYLEDAQPEDLKKLRLYEDTMVPLVKLYPIEKTLTEALGKRVWLKSGGYLVIEPTEAMTVIDVNTGKYSGKKNLRDTILKINLEAAKETARQMMLRNLSGIIIVDFIDMEMEEDRRLLCEKLSEYCAGDPVKTVVVDMTKLNLVEITRKKTRKPLHETVGLKGDRHL